MISAIAKRCLPPFLVLVPAVANAQNATIAGAATSPYPTLENLSVEWQITGDDNLDGVVSVRFCEQGAGTWRTGMPLRRVPAGSNTGFSWSNKHSGSIFGLEPGTTYEIELTLSDPDGGDTTTTITAATRPVPVASATGTVKPVTPSTFPSELGSAQQGDIFLLADGTYSGFTVNADGTAAEPIVIRAENPGQVTVTGEVRMDGQAFIYIEGLVINHQVKFNNAEGIVVRGCTINTPGDGIVSYVNGVTNGYFADNIILGVTTWEDGNVGAGGADIGEGIEITGPGNVIVHNYIKGFRDAISTMEDSGASNQVSIDIMYNDIEVGADDAIEADFTMGNTRVMYNRITNSFVGLSSQPSLGGPAYFIRNVMYNVIYSPFKLHRSTVGDVALHNTVVKCGDAFAVPTGDTWSRALFRNNLLIGGTGGGSYGGYSNGSGRVAYLPAADSTCHFDYDGFGSIGTGVFEGNIGGASFSSLAGMHSSTSEARAREVDLSVFADTIPFLDSGPYPERPIPDLRLAGGTEAIDGGVAIANVNDGFAGSAPDLGAYELGATLPNYGPRPGEHPDVSPPPDGGPVADGAPPGDPGVTGDPGAGDGDTPVADGGTSTWDGGSTGDESAGGGALSSGCECASAAVRPAFLLLVLIRRRGRKLNRSGR